MTTLYHARRWPDEEEQKTLSPTTREPQKRNERVGQFLFATHRLDPDSPLTRFHGDRSDKVRSKVFSNKIYSMDSEGFEQVVKNPREWIIDRPVENIQVVAHVNTIDQALKQGIQYFSMSNDAPTVPIDESPFQLLANLSREDSLTAERLAQAIAADPQIVWENESTASAPPPSSRAWSTPSAWPCWRRGSGRR